MGYLVKSTLVQPRTAVLEAQSLHPLTEENAESGVKRTCSVFFPQ